MSWKWSTIGGCCELTSGGTPSKQNPRFWDGPLPFVSARDLKADRISSAALTISPKAVEQSSTKIAPVGSLLMLVRGMGLANGIQIGEVIAPVAFNQDIRAIHPPRDLLIPRFLLLALRHSFLSSESEDVLSSAAHGTLKIDTDALKRIAIPLPPLPEQRRIVAILDEAFAGIATAKANTEKNLRNARELFDSHLEVVFSGRGDGWPVKQLRDVCDFEGGSQPPKSKFVHSSRPGYIRFLQIRDFGSERHVTYIPESNKNRLCESDDVMIGRYGASVGKILTGLAGAYNVALIKVIPNVNVIERRYLYFYLVGKPFQDQLRGVAARSAQAGFGKDDVFPFQIPLPQRNDQRRVIVELDNLFAETQRLASLYEQKLAALDALKKSLLHQAFTGQLTAGTATKEVAHVG